MQKIKSIIDYEIIISVDRDFISIKHPAATAITYSNRVFNNEYYKMKKPKNGFCLVKEDGPDVIRTRDPRHVKAPLSITTTALLSVILDSTQT
jgi:hypothetical protein